MTNEATAGASVNVVISSSPALDTILDEIDARDSNRVDGLLKLCPMVAGDGDRAIQGPNLVSVPFSPLFFFFSLFLGLLAVRHTHLLRLWHYVLCLLFVLFPFLVFFSSTGSSPGGYAVQRK